MRWNSKIIFLDIIHFFRCSLKIITRTFIEIEHFLFKINNNNKVISTVRYSTVHKKDQHVFRVPK